MVTKLFFICDWILELTHVIKWHRLKHTHTHTHRGTYILVDCSNVNILVILYYSFARCYR